MPQLTRRSFMAGLCGSISAIGGCQYSLPSDAVSDPLKESGKSAIRHIVLCRWRIAPSITIWAGCPERMAGRQA